MSSDYETSQARNADEFLREQGLARDLTVSKKKPSYVGSDASRPIHYDDLKAAIDPKSKLGQQKYFEERDREELEKYAARGSPVAIAKLAGPACTICGRYNPFETYEGKSLNSLVCGYLREYFKEIMPGITSGSESLAYHVAYHHEPETKHACEVVGKKYEIIRRWQYIQEMLRRKILADERHDYDEAAKLHADVHGWMKVMVQEAQSNPEVKALFERSDDPKDKFLYDFCYERKLKENVPYEPPAQGGSA